MIDGWQLKVQFFKMVMNEVSVLWIWKKYLCAEFIILFFYVLLDIHFNLSPDDFVCHTILIRFIFFDWRYTTAVILY